MQFYLKCVAFVQAIILSAAMVHIYHLNNQNKIWNERLPEKEAFSPNIILKTTFDERGKNESIQNLSDVINENDGPDPLLFGPMKES